MRGIHCALRGRLGADVELRRSASGNDWCRRSVGVGEGDEVTWVSVAVFEEKARALAGLAKGAAVYVEGRLSLNAWTGKDGQRRPGLSVAAREVMSLARRTRLASRRVWRLARHLWAANRPLAVKFTGDVR